MEDIRNEIRALEQHANEIGADAPRRADLMQEIGIKYGSLYGHTTAASDLGKIIHYYRKALDLTPTDGTNRAGLLRNIGMAYLLMYRELKNVQYLVEAITHVERALEAAPTNGPNRAQILRDLAVAYGQNYEQTREKEDLNALSLRRVIMLLIFFFPLRSPSKNYLNKQF
ncbi:uncharacterized protein F4807DRAFT_119395 [Annulohypoxylon truncatum]|uniref:uncharacterized protein n=1 Tax=Annulohypoxylon truncatum TaxID=327061 RepID=UPI002008052D|nr:uncharacterized protein F4807DRAFT_119395 [Annulohypoxylon truncatum]KAI1214269.1 hypothetical protein F4807DRAFT_119395 [Annulohypoxylon truncatum]